MRTLFLQALSFEGFDGGAGSRYQARREIRSFWYPTWLAQPAALVENSTLIDAPPHRLKLAQIVGEMIRSPQMMKRRFVTASNSFISCASAAPRIERVTRRPARPRVRGDPATGFLPPRE